MRRISRSVIFVLAIVSGCSDAADDDAITSPSANTAVSAHSAASISPQDDPKAKFRAKNHLDWVGRAHNKALDDFAAMVAKKGPPQNFCETLVDFMSAEERLPADKGRTDGAARRAAAIAGLRVTGECKGHFASNGASAWLAAAAVTDSFSYAANRLFDRIQAAQSASATSSELAGYLITILAEADNLGQVDRDAVYVVASIAQSSFEYWEVNSEPLALIVDATYGSCLGGYTDMAWALDVCMGIKDTGVQPIGYESFDLMGPTYVSFVKQEPEQENCDDHMNHWALGFADIGGAIAGAFVGTFFMPAIGTVIGAINTSGTASTIASWSMAGRVIHCRLTAPKRSPGDTMPQPL